MRKTGKMRKQSDGEGDGSRRQEATSCGHALRGRESQRRAVAGLRMVAAYRKYSSFESGGRSHCVGRERAVIQTTCQWTRKGKEVVDRPDESRAPSFLLQA